MEVDHAAAKKATAERHDEEVDAQDAAEKAMRGKLEAEVQAARNAVKESVWRSSLTSSSICVPFWFALPRKRTRPRSSVRCLLFCC